MAASDSERNGERFEDQLEKLEEIVGSLEDETVGLEEALELFERGMALAKSCRVRLEEVEHRVRELLETSEDEAPETAPIEDGACEPEPDW